MSGRKRSLTDLCGGRFGIVPAAVSDSPDVQNGPFRLYAVMCARAKPNGTSPPIPSPRRWPTV